MKENIKGKQVERDMRACVHTAVVKHETTRQSFA